MGDSGLLALGLLAALAFIFTSPGAGQNPWVVVFMAMPVYVRVSSSIFFFCTAGTVLMVVVRFLSQDWAGAKIRYEERRVGRKPMGDTRD